MSQLASPTHFNGMFIQNIQLAIIKKLNPFQSASDYLPLSKKCNYLLWISEFSSKGNQVGSPSRDNDHLARSSPLQGWQFPCGFNLGRGSSVSLYQLPDRFLVPGWFVASCLQVKLNFSTVNTGRDTEKTHMETSNHPPPIVSHTRNHFDLDTTDRVQDTETSPHAPGETLATGKEAHLPAGAHLQQYLDCALDCSDRGVHWRGCRGRASV